MARSCSQVVLMRSHISKVIHGDRQCSLTVSATTVVALSPPQRLLHKKGAKIRKWEENRENRDSLSPVPYLSPLDPRAARHFTLPCP